MPKKALLTLETLARRWLEKPWSRLFGRRALIETIVGACANAIAATGDNAGRLLVRLAPEAVAELEASVALPAAEQIEKALAQTLGVDAPEVELVADTALSSGAIGVTVEELASAEEAPLQRTRTLATGKRRAANAAIAAREASLVLAGGQHVRLDKPFLSLGRHADNDVVLSLPQVSRRHAQMRWRFGRFILYDLNSQAGTFVNDRRVQDCVLRDGDIIRLADVTLLYVEHDAPTQRRAAVRSETDNLDEQTRIMPRRE